MREDVVMTGQLTIDGREVTLHASAHTNADGSRTPAMVRGHDGVLYYVGAEQAARLFAAPQTIRGQLAMERVVSTLEDLRAAQDTLRVAHAAYVDACQARDRLVLAALAEGESHAAIARMLGVNRSRISQLAGRARA